MLSSSVEFHTPNISGEDDGIGVIVGGRFKISASDLQLISNTPSLSFKSCSDFANCASASKTSNLVPIPASNFTFASFKLNWEALTDSLPIRRLSSELCILKKAVKAFNLPSIEQINYEADDLLATYARQIIDLGAKVTIISSDKDLMQLVSKEVRLFDPMKSKVIGEKEVLEKFGVKPNQVIDVQSLAGDSSDNIPGVPGIGIKTAAELINKYKNLDTLLKKASEIPQNKRRETLLENKDKALLSRQLVTLKEDVPVEDDPSSFIIKEVKKDNLYNFLREMEFNRLLSQAISFYGEDNISNSCLLYTSPSPRDRTRSRMPSSA